MSDSDTYTYDYQPSAAGGLRVVTYGFDKWIPMTNPRLEGFWANDSGQGGKVTLLEPIYEFDDYVPEDIKDHETMRLLGME